MQIDYCVSLTQVYSVNMQKSTWWKPVLIVAIIALVSVIASIASVVWLYPYGNRPNRNIADQQPRANKPYYPQLKFAISLLNELQKDEPNGNILYSPHTVYRLFLQILIGADGETEQELKKLLQLNWIERKADIEYVHSLHEGLWDNRFKNHKIELYSADKLFFSQDVVIR